MDLNEDRDLLYIAKEGLVAPLPEPWYHVTIMQETLLVPHW
jgi:hypothetical protein